MRGFSVWTVCENGYLIDNDPDNPDGTVLCPNIPHGSRGEYHVRTYNLLEKPGLYRYFSELSDNECDVINFSNKYGMLNQNEHELLSDWYKEINHFKFVLKIWDSRFDTNSLKKFIKFDDVITVTSDDRTKYYFNHKPYVQNSVDKVYRDQYGVAYLMLIDPYIDLSTPDKITHLLEDQIFKTQHAVMIGIEKNNYQRAAQFFVQWSINNKLEDVHCSVMWASMIDKTVKRKNNRLELLIEPKSLVSAIWLQFAQSLEGAPELIKCPVCGDYFRIVKGRNRKSRKTCSDACKSKLNRERKRITHEMYRKGASPNQISEEVGSSLNTINRWIGEIL